MSESIVVPRGKPSSAVVGSRVRLRFIPSSSGPTERSSVVEGTLAAIDFERFTIALDNRDTTRVSRGQAMGIMVRERASKRPAAIGAAIFGFFMGTAMLARNTDSPTEPGGNGVLKWAAAGAVAGVAVVVFSPDKQWVTTTFPP
jgi:hypothetical protein